MTRILVVEDEPGIALGLEDDLKMEGYEVEVTGDGAVASRRARETVFDLILLDVMLPGGGCIMALMEDSAGRVGLQLARIADKHQAESVGHKPGWSESASVP